MGENPLLTEYDDWKHLTTTKEWECYVQLLNRHRVYLQREVNRCVRENDREGAIKALAQMDLIPRLLGKVTVRMTELEKGAKHGSNVGV